MNAGLFHAILANWIGRGASLRDGSRSRPGEMELSDLFLQQSSAKRRIAGWKSK